MCFLLQFMTEAERKEMLRRAILHRAPNLSSRSLDCICNSVNTQRRYFIKHTSNEQKFLNLATQETIVTKDNRVFCTVLPIFGEFTCPYFERIGERSSSREGKINLSLPAAAVKIRIGYEQQNKYAAATYFLLLFSPNT